MANREGYMEGAPRFCCECGKTLTDKGILCLECGRKIFGERKCDRCGSSEVAHGYLGEKLCSKCYIRRRIEETGECKCECPSCVKARKEMENKI